MYNFEALLTRFENKQDMYIPSHQIILKTKTILFFLILTKLQI